MIFIKSVMYGLVLFFLLIRKRSNYQEIINEVGALPPLIMPMIEYSLIFSVVLLIALSVLKIISGKLFLPKKYIAIYVFAITLYNIRVFDMNKFGLSLAGILITAMIFLCACKDRYEINSGSVIIRKSFIICFSFFCISNIVLMLFGYGYHGYRFSGFTFHPNQLGFAAGLASVFFLIISTNSESAGKYKLLYTLFFAASITLLVASGSRGAIVATLSGFLYWVMMQKKNAIKFFIPAIIVGSSAFILSLFSDQYSLLKARIFDTGDNRTDVWATMINGFLESPLIGLGENAIGSESSVLKALSVGGLICGIPVIIVTYRLASSLLKNIYAKEKTNSFMPLLAVVVVGSLVDGYLFERFGFTALFLVMLLSFAIESNNKRNIACVNSVIKYPRYDGFNSCVKRLSDG